jgi:hypothetical protein
MWTNYNTGEVVLLTPSAPIEQYDPKADGQNDVNSRMKKKRVCCTEKNGAITRLTSEHDWNFSLWLSHRSM